MKVIEFHRSGWIYIVVSIVIGVLALNGGNNFHYLTEAAILGYMLSSGIAGYTNIRRADVSLSFPDEIYARSPFLLDIEVRNKSRVPVYMIDVGVRGERVFFSVIQPGETVSRHIPFTLPSRGVNEIKDIELSSGYPFNFFTRYWPVRFVGKATVFPAPLGSRRDGAGAWVKKDEREGESGGRDEDVSDIMGVRPYAEGDPMKMIHWKSSARTGKLNSRLYDGSAARKTRMIDLDALISEMGVEAGLSAAAYEISASMKSGLPIGMADRGTIWAPSPSRPDKLSMLSSLALYE
jgi:uncharacterized protein (DUF58 family)